MTATTPRMTVDTASSSISMTADAELAATITTQQPAPISSDVTMLNTMIHSPANTSPLRTTATAMRRAGLRFGAVRIAGSGEFMAGNPLCVANFVVTGPERVQADLPQAPRYQLHLDIGPEDCPNRPFHLRLTLSDTKATVDHGHLDDRSPLVAAAMLQALRKARLVDGEAGIEGFDGDHQVDRVQAARNLVAQVDQAVAGIAGQNGRDQEPVHRSRVDYFAPSKRPSAGGSLRVGQGRSGRRDRNVV